MLSLFILTPFSPIKFSLTLTVWSILAALTCLNWRVRWIFLISSMVINFSSAIIIIFCFCSILRNFETIYIKNNVIKFIIIVLTLICIISDYRRLQKISLSNIMIYFNLWWFILICSLILFCIVGINYSIILPKKKIIELY